jgi:iron-sulfur cluster assembly protein
MSTSVAALASPPSVPDVPTDGVRAGDEGLVRLTEAAGQKVAALIAREKQGDHLRVAIAGGGCNGLSYKLRFTTGPKRGDILVATAGARVLVDVKTALYLRGTVVDFSDRMIGGGFKLTNPNAKASCSCGESFSV